MFMLFDVSLFLKFCSCEFKFFVPRLPKSAYERLFEKLVKGQVEFLAQCQGRPTDTPLMIVECGVVTHFLETYRIEMARDGFVVGTASFTISLVDGTETTTIVIASENTVLAINDACHQFAPCIRIDHTILFDDTLSLSAQFVPNNGGRIFQSRHLLNVDGGTSITLNATRTLTRFQVAAEPHLEDVERHKCVLDFYH
jgi:hypothetical protein